MNVVRSVQASSSNKDEPTLLQVRGLRTRLFTKRGVGEAVNGVSFDLAAGETLGLVGESGSGKSMTALSIIRLNPSHVSRIVGGEVIFRGQDLLRLPERVMRKYRGKRISLVMQDASAALNPSMSIGRQLFESIRLHRGISGSEARAAAVRLLELFRIAEPGERLQNYPHQMSGGMRQRAVGAIALSGNPDVLIADEPTTALDVTIQAAYLQLLRDLQRVTGLAILFITHDFGVVARICDRVAVMYAGRIVETASTRALFNAPAHPYTRALLESVPDVRAPRESRLRSIEGQPPSIYEVGNGCAFAPRCPLVQARCWKTFPPTVTLSSGTEVRCWAHVRD
jgi:oligopeptide/dipeptide ABC transporter ATP-binding protein